MQRRFIDRYAFASWTCATGRALRFIDSYGGNLGPDSAEIYRRAIRIAQMLDTGGGLETKLDLAKKKAGAS